MFGRLPAKMPMVELSPTPSTAIDSERYSARRDIMALYFGTTLFPSVN